jgi:hypothetical protein
VDYVFVDFIVYLVSFWFQASKFSFWMKWQPYFCSYIAKKFLIVFYLDFGFCDMKINELEIDKDKIYDRTLLCFCKT